MLVKLQSAVSLLTCSCLVSLAASPSSIGFVVTHGQAMVDGATVQGNATLFQGSLVQADKLNSDLMVSDGSNLLLQPGASANVYGSYALLRSGTALERGGHGYVIVANGLRISSLSPQGAVMVGLTDHLEVRAQGGAAEVRSAAGMLLARLDSGRALRFDVQAPTQSAPQQNPAAPALPASPAPPPAAAIPEPGQQLTLHGILRKDHAGSYGHYLLTDLVSHLTYELQGPGLDDLVGGSVEVTGTILATSPVPAASRVLSISDVHQMTISEMPGNPEAEPPPPTESAATAPPTPSGDVTPSPGAGPEVGARPAVTAPPEPDSPPAAPPFKPPSDTAKILVIVALAAGGGIGVALGLGSGKSSTVSPE